MRNDQQNGSRDLNTKCGSWREEEEFGFGNEGGGERGREKLEFVEKREMILRQPVRMEGEKERPQSET